ncbi:MAG: cell division protein FtsB [Pseudomonadota bacterium]
MLKIVVILLALLFTALQYQLWFGEGSWPRAQAMREKLELQMSENEKLQQSNAVMEAEVLDLKTGLDAIEERARADLGLVRQGDVYFQVIQPAAQSGQNLAGQNPLGQASDSTLKESKGDVKGETKLDEAQGQVNHD